MKPPFLSMAIALIVPAAIACGQGAAQPVSSPPVEESAQAEPAVRPDRVPLIKGPVSADGLQAILGTADLGVGTNRVGFVLTSPDGIVSEPVVVLSSRYYATDGSESELRQNVEAEYQPWPYGVRGLYTTMLDFDVAGRWGIDIAVEGQDGTTKKALLLFDVLESPAAPAVGAAAVKSRSKTVADVETLAQLSTGSTNDEELYQTTIADAVSSGKPTVVVFASPAFCTNAVCGPQLDVLRQLKDRYRDQAHFIHVDFYDNPEEIQGDLDRARISPTVAEWGLPSIEWSFVIDRQGSVAARFEAFATFEEVEKALLQVL